VIPTALSIAGSDPSGGAGIQADLKTFMDLEVYGMAAITAITVQNTQGVQEVHPLPPDLVGRQVQAIIDDLPISAIKVGLVSQSADVIREVLQHQGVPIILDPVLASSSGTPFATSQSLPALRALLDGDAPASWAQETGTAVLHTGGHGQAESLEDVLYLPSGRCIRTPHPRVHSPATHGTGCTLSSAITAGMARGWPLDRAVDAGINATVELIALSAEHPLGQGTSPLLHGLIKPGGPS
jgi:hydroxymethylpyrimidine/phosphomethylpyrimidine kinase